MYLRALMVVFVSLVLISNAAAEIYTIEDEFDGCEYGKIYPLTNGQYFRCDSYKFFYKYRPKVVAFGKRVIAVDEQEVRGTILDGRTISTYIDGDWEGCDFDVHRLANGLYLMCNTYFYEYAFMPSVEIIIIEGKVEAVLINGKSKNGVFVVTQ